MEDYTLLKKKKLEPVKSVKPPERVAEAKESVMPKIKVTMLRGKTGTGAGGAGGNANNSLNFSKSGNGMYIPTM